MSRADPRSFTDLAARRSARLQAFKVIELQAGGFILWRGFVLILRRSGNERYFPGLWELPSGSVKDNETLADSCRREVLEETGIPVGPVEAASAFEYWISRGGSRVHRVQINFICVLDTPLKPVVRLSSEHQQFRWVSLDACGDGLVSEETRQAWITAEPRMREMAEGE